MIIRETNNSPVAAPEVADVTEMLEAYRLFSGISFATTDNMFDFLTKPSVQRDLFIEQRGFDVIFFKSDFIQQIIK